MDEKPSLADLGLDAPIAPPKATKSWEDVANEADQAVDLKNVVRCRKCSQLIHRESAQCAFCKAAVQHQLAKPTHSQSSSHQTCRFCRSKVDPQAIKCPHCQGWLREQWNGIAAVLSFVIPGLGQMYRGHVFNGVCLFICTALGYFFFVIPGIVIHILVTIEAGRPSR